MVTGVGLHTALGDTSATVRACRRGESAVRRAPLGAGDAPPEVTAAPAASLSLRPWVDNLKLLKYMSLPAQLAVAAAGQALDQARLLGGASAKASMALFVNTGLIAFDFAQVQHTLAASKGDDGGLDLARFGRHGLRRCHPLMPFKMLLNMPLGLVSIVFGIQGHNSASYPGVMSCAAGLQQALRGVAQGRFSRALVGASAHDVSLLPSSTALGAGHVASSPRAAQPLTASHRGYALADMAAFLVLESARAAQARGAATLATLSAAAWLSQGVDAARTSPAPRRAGHHWLTGSLDHHTDRALAEAVAPSPLHSYDGALGFSPAASLLSTLALACSDLPAAAHDPQGDHRQGCVWALDAGGGAARVALRAPGPEGSA